MKEIKANNKIKVPWMKSKEWRDTNVKGWNDPALQAYLERQDLKNMIGTCLLVAAGVMSGMILQLKLIMG
jgi:hypothetical protein